MTTWDHYLDETPYTWADYQTFRAWYAGDPRRADTLDAHRARRLCLMVDAQAERIAELTAELADARSLRDEAVGNFDALTKAVEERIATLETGFKAAHAANQDLSGRIAALEAAAKELEEALRLFVHAGTGDAKLIAWRRVAEGRAAMRALLSGAR